MMNASPCGSPRPAHGRFTSCYGPANRLRNKAPQVHPPLLQEPRTHKPQTKLDPIVHCNSKPEMADDELVQVSAAGFFENTWTHSCKIRAARLAQLKQQGVQSGNEGGGEEDQRRSVREEFPSDVLFLNSCLGNKRQRPAPLFSPRS